MNSTLPLNGIVLQVLSVTVSLQQEFMRTEQFTLLRELFSKHWNWRLKFKQNAVVVASQQPQQKKNRTKKRISHNFHHTYGSIHEIFNLYIWPSIYVQFDGGYALYYFIAAAAAIAAAAEPLSSSVPHAIILNKTNER